MTELSKSLSLTLGDGETVEDYLVAEADLAEIPLVLQGSEGNTYAQTDENDLGSEITFFTIDDEENKQILGYAEIQDIESQEDDGLGDLELAVENAQVAVDDAELGIGDTQTPLATAREEVDRIEALLTSAEAELDNIGATDGNFVIEYTKTPDSKNYAGVIVGNLAVTSSTTFLSTLEAAPLPLRHASTLQKQARLFVCRLLIALLKVPMQTMYMPK